MIINCPQCSARFLVADAKIPPEGRTVRCGNCGNQWHVTRPLTDEEAASLATPVGFDEAPDEIKPLEQGANVPALTPRRLSARPFKIAAPILAAIWLILASVTYFPRWVELPVISSLYHLFGITSTRGLVFSNVHIERDTAEAKTKFIFSGSIVNHADVDRTVPTVHVALKDKQGKVIWGRDYAVNATLKAGEVYPFRINNVETSFADRVAVIVLDLGHSLELMMR